MDICENCAKKAEKLESCQYCQKQFCPNCFPSHLRWERQHQDWSLYQSSAGTGMSGRSGSRDEMTHGPGYQKERKRRKYRRPNHH